MYPTYEEIRGEMRARGLESLISDVYIYNAATSIGEPGLCALVKRVIEKFARIHISQNLQGLPKGEAGPALGEVRKSLKFCCEFGRLSIIEPNGVASGREFFGDDEAAKGSVAPRLQNNPFSLEPPNLRDQLPLICQPFPCHIIEPLYFSSVLSPGQYRPQQFQIVGCSVGACFF